MVLSYAADAYRLRGKGANLRRKSCLKPIKQGLELFPDGFAAESKLPFMWYAVLFLGEGFGQGGEAICPYLHRTVSDPDRDRQPFPGCLSIKKVIGIGHNDVFRLITGLGAVLLKIDLLPGVPGVGNTFGQ